MRSSFLTVWVSNIGRDRGTCFCQVIQLRQLQIWVGTKMFHTSCCFITPPLPNCHDVTKQNANRILFPVTRLIT